MKLDSNRLSPIRGGLFLFAALMLAGCGRNPQPGGGTDTATPAGGLGGAPPPNDVAAAPPPVEQAARPKKAKPAPVERTLPSQDPTINPHDVFEVARLQPAVEKVEEQGQPVSADRYAAIFPPRGVDSTSFRLAALPTESSGNSPATSAAPFRGSSSAAVSDDSSASTSAGPSASSSSGSTAVRRRGTSPGKSSSKTLAGRRLAAKSVESSKTKVSGDDEPNGGKTLPAGFSDISRGGQKYLGWPVRIRCDRDGAEMAIVKGGAVTVGHDGGPPESSPQITVVLDSYYMDVTEVTLEQYQRFRQA